MAERVFSFCQKVRIARPPSGVIYQRMHTVFGQAVAVKAISPNPTLNPESRQRLLNQVKVKRHLQRPNIVRTLEILVEHRRFYAVMKFLEEKTLAKHRRQFGWSMQAREAIAFLQEVVAGLEFAHRDGVIHRDIKRSNLTLTQQSLAKMTDFANARALFGQARAPGNLALKSRLPVAGVDPTQPTRPSDRHLLKGHQALRNPDRLIALRPVKDSELNTLDQVFV